MKRPSKVRQKNLTFGGRFFINRTLIQELTDMWLSV
jgi:hypothetical protein